MSVDDISNKNEREAPLLIDESNTLTFDQKPSILNNDSKHTDEKRQDDDNQNVPEITRDINKKLLDDDNDTQNPAYIPRKGKFYEHDDRTLDDNDELKQEISKDQNRLYKDFDTKWQHDLYFRNEQISKSRNSIPRQSHNRFERGNNYDREQPHSNNYMPRSGDYHRPRFSHENYNQSRINSFDFKDFSRPLSYNRNTYENTQATPRRQGRDYNPYQVDDQTFHRRRNSTNSQFQQQDNILKPNRKQFGEQINNHNQFKSNKEYHNHGGRRYDLYETKNNLPPRLQTNNNRNLTQKQQNSTLHFSTDASDTERPKRYSNMRSTMPNPIQQQTKHYQDQRSNNIDQNDWPQAPPPPTSYLPQQIMTPQMYYNQPTSRYVSMNCSRASISKQLQEN